MTSIYVKCDGCGATLDRYTLADDPRTGDGTFGRNPNEARGYAEKMGWSCSDPGRWPSEGIDLCPKCINASSAE
jgi:hypothetical protein